MRSRKIIYIAGPITGVPEYQRPFNAAEKELTAAGYGVINPARLPPELPNEKAMPICFAMLAAADAVLLLPGSTTSSGALLERGYAQYLGIPTTTNIAELKEVAR